MSPRFFVACLLLGFGISVPAAAPLKFNRDIHPILSDNCFACHGPDGNSRKADLRFDRGLEAMPEGIIVPGNAAKSEFIKRL